MIIKHTELPWILTQDRRQIVNHKGETVAKLTALDIENAEFIVRACNAYYDLVDALNGIETIEHGDGAEKVVWLLLRSDGNEIGAGSVRLDGEFAKAMSKYTEKRRDALTKTEAKQ